jgi:plasmid stabilization system protein ParE
MYRAEILSLAKRDIQDAASWYNDQQQGLGNRFMKFVRVKISKILLNPKAYQVRYSNVHTVVLDVFPFMVHFRINEESKTIIIIAVLHTSRNPAKWEG